jgi:class 3 adenylate cyclase/CHASE2 domain-containing sensor protein
MEEIAVAEKSEKSSQDLLKHIVQAAIGLGGALLFVGLSYTGFYDIFESRLLDQRFMIRGPVAMDPVVKTIDIDAFTLGAEGRIQDWDRDKHAKIIPMLKDLGARMLGYDYYFVEPSSRTLAYDTFLESEVTSREEFNTMFPDYDEYMRALMEDAGNVILGQTVNDNPPADADLLREAVKRLEPYYREYPEWKTSKLDTKTNLETPLPDLISASQGVGLAMTDADIDGSVRHYPIVKVYDGKAFPALALAMICEYIGVQFKDAEIVPGKYLALPEGKLPDGTPITVKIPIDDSGKMMVNWCGRWDEPDFEHIPHLAVTMYHERRFKEPLNRAIKKIFIEHPATYAEEDTDILIAELEKAGFPLEEHGSDIEEIFWYLYIMKILEESYINEGVEPTADELPEENRPQYNQLKMNHAVLKTLQEQPELTYDEILKIHGEENWELIKPIYYKLTSELLPEGGPHPEDYPLVFQDVDINDRFMTDEDFKGSVFFYGLTAAGTWDLNPMPYDDRYPMLGLHANAFNTILTQNFLQRFGHGYNIAIMLAGGLLMGLLIGRFKPLPGAGLTVLIFIGYLAGNQFLFQKMGYWVDILGPVGTLVVGYMTITVYNFFSEEKEKKMIRGIFSRYVTKSVVDELIKNPDMVKLGGERKELTVFFSDVAGFTSVSEVLSPEDLVALLNDYLTVMTNIILRYDGMVDKYEGDAIMAVFGTPVPLPDHALRAILVSLEMQKELVGMRARWKEEGRPELEVRIGLNTGQMIAGNMGAADRLDYTVMGDSVNLGSRLESANKAYGTFFMISEYTLEHCEKDIQYRFLDSLRVKGKNLPVKVYEVLGAKKEGFEAPDTKMQAAELYEQGVQHYLKQEWDQGIQLFDQAMAVEPDDPPSQVYRERCETFKVNPPGEDWDGVYVMTTK